MSRVFKIKLIAILLRKIMVNIIQENFKYFTLTYLVKDVYQNFFFKFITFISCEVKLRTV